MPRVPGVVEPLEPQLAAAGIAPEAQHVAAPEVADPRIVQEDHRVLLLYRRVRDPELERVLVGRRLEPEAIALYERAGFARIPAFGEYVHSPLRVCMAKDLEGR